MTLIRIPNEEDTRSLESVQLRIRDVLDFGDRREFVCGINPSEEYPITTISRRGRIKPEVYFQFKKYAINPWLHWLLTQDGREVRKMSGDRLYEEIDAALKGVGITNETESDTIERNWRENQKGLKVLTDFLASSSV
jgi:hypothetical protein